MKIVTLMLSRNEAWCIGATVRAALEWSDTLVFMDHASTDETVDIIEQVRRDVGIARIVYARNDEPGHWAEMIVRQRTLDIARNCHATHIGIIDADEMVTANQVKYMRDYFATLRPGEQLHLPQVATYHSLDQRRTDEPWPQKWMVGFCDAHGVTWRPASDGYQYHMRPPHGTHASMYPPVEGLREGGLFHFQHASLRRLRAKAVWYKMDETLRWPGRMSPDELNRKYDWTLRESSPSLMQIPPEWWGNLRRDLIDIEREPWQEREVFAMLDAHGVDKFRGIEPHGLFDKWKQGATSNV